MSFALFIISTGIFLLAVLFSVIQGIGFYVSLGLLVLGCFSMMVVGILRESSPKDGLLATQKIIVQDPDDIYS
jgi:hypothetical protein